MRKITYFFFQISVGFFFVVFISIDDFKSFGIHPLSGYHAIYPGRGDIHLYIHRGHSDPVNIDANQMDASKIDATIYQKHNKRYSHKYNKVYASLHNFII